MNLKVINHEQSESPFKKANLSSSFGSLKGKLKMSGQQFKDLVRKGWGQAAFLNLNPACNRTNLS